MNEIINSMYKYFLTTNYNKKDGWSVIDFVTQHSTKSGKLFCWHNWVQFEVIPYGFNTYTNDIESRCTKCGLISKVWRPKRDPNLINNNLRVVE